MSRPRLPSKVFDRLDSDRQGSGFIKDAPVGDDAKKTREAGVAKGIATGRRDLFAEPDRKAIVLRKVLSMGVDEDIYVREDH
jgi:hypothetical protein